MKADKDAATISSLQKLTAQLKKNIEERDQLVRDLVDSLLSDFIKSPNGLNESERKSIASRINSRNLFYNIERTVADNIQFIKVTRMTPEDLSEMKKQYRDFNKSWKQIGSKLGAVYLNRKEKTSEISSIDSIFDEWNRRIDDEIWGQISKLFNQQNINMLEFNSGDQFENSVESFIDDEIKNFGVKSKTESEKTFIDFTDSVYFKSVQPTWIPILISNKMFTEANKDTIESRLAKWKATVAPSSGISWIFILFIAIAIIVIFVLLITRRKSTASIEKNE